MSQQGMSKPAKAKPSAEADETPEQRHVEPARTVAIAGRYLGRFVGKDDGSVSWQRFAGHPSLGAELISVTRSAIAGCDGDSLEVVQKLIKGLPEAVLAKCANADADPIEISRKVERYLPPPDGTDQGLRSEMVARRLACFDAHPNVEHVHGNRWRGSTYADLDPFALDMEAVDRANADLLYQREWRKIPNKVLQAILTGLGYPKPENLDRGHEPWEISKARPK